MTNQDNWRLEPHCCRSCFSRIASRPTEDGHRLYQCTHCGLEAEGSKPNVVCACGTKLRRGKAAVFTDAGIRCHENKAKSPEFPAQYVASYGGAQCEA